MAPELNGRFLSRQPLKGRFAKQRASGYTTDTQPLSFFRGDSINLALQVFDETGTPWDLAEVETIKSTWKEEECLVQTTLCLELGGTGEHGIIEVTDAGKGRLSIVIPANISKSLLPINYVFDVEITMQNGTVGTVLKRYVEIMPDITEA
jgi:hypothetical protein